MIKKKKKIYDWQLIRDWANYMSRSTKGKITLSNIIFAWRNRCISKNLILRCLLVFARSWASSPSRPMEVVLKEIIDKLPQTYFCRGEKVLNNHIPYSRIMHVNDLLNHNIDVAKTGLSIRGRLLPRHIKHFERFGFEKCAIGEMKTTRPFSWITPTAALKIVRDKYSPDKVATASRNLLGLNSFVEDEHLVEILYPSVRILPRSPTFLEASPSIVFRAKNEKDGWGRAVNLGTLKDGLPEAVLPRIEFSSGFKLLNLGTLRRVRRTFNWEKFGETFPYPWHPRIMREVIEYARHR